MREAGGNEIEPRYDIANSCAASMARQRQSCRIARKAEIDIILSWRGGVTLQYHDGRA